MSVHIIYVYTMVLLEDKKQTDSSRTRNDRSIAKNNSSKP